MEKGIQKLAADLTEQVQKVIVGKEKPLRLMLAALLCQGHILLDDLPGVGKTTLIKTLSIALGCDFKRVQFTSDLLPSDVLGMHIFDRKTDDFRLLQGPVMTNVLLADEINRAIPRTQSALLEAMEERQVTLDGDVYPLPLPFLVMATQNPVDLESTFRLPAAQLDRFFLRLTLGYPSPEQELEMLRIVGNEIPFGEVRPVTGPEEICAFQREIWDVHVSDSVLNYIVALSDATRNHPLIRTGVSPRGSRALYRGVKALAAMDSRSFATPDDVLELLAPVFCHRIVLKNEARLAGKDAQALINEITGTVAVPPDRGALFDVGAAI